MRLTFVAHFIIVLACLGAAFFAWSAGVPQAVWGNGVGGWFGLAIGALALSAAIWLGWQAWLADTPPTYLGLDARGMRIDGRPTVDSSYGRLIELYCPGVGMLGTVVGLGEAFAHAGDTMAMIQSGRTAFYSTGCGIVGMLVVMAMVHSLETGIKRGAR